MLARPSASLMPAAQSAAARDRARDQGQGRDDGRGRASGGAVEEEEGWADGDQGLDIRTI